MAFLSIPVALGALVLATTPCLPYHSGASRVLKGDVVGRIEACSGIVPAKPQYVGGRVLALRGVVRWAQTSPTTSRLVLPSDVIARQQVPVGGHFHFSLVPGRYVIDLPHYASGNAATWASVTVRGGETAHVDLPNRCI
jgi:hypothetical protein